MKEGILLSLQQYGWNDSLNEEIKKYTDKNLKPARVTMESKNLYKLYTDIGEVEAKVSGKFMYEAMSKADFPSVGDWVAISLREDEKNATIHSVLPRKSSFLRKVAGTIPDSQVIAANFDYVFIMTSLNNNFSLRRIERYLAIAWDSGGLPIIILSKADLCDNIDEKVSSVESITPGVPIHAVSSETGDGIETLFNYVASGNTITIVGSSGVGKSTLLNKLSNENLMDTSAIREEDSKGRHTTTHRQMFLLPSGGLIIDTPGTRELGLWDIDSGITETFGDIEGIALGCKFKDCKHEKEPGCKVREALVDGILDSKRLDSYVKLKKELKYIEAKNQHASRVKEKKKMKNSKDHKFKIYQE